MAVITEDRADAILMFLDDVNERPTWMQIHAACLQEAGEPPARTFEIVRVLQVKRLIEASWLEGDGVRVRMQLTKKGRAAAEIAYQRFLDGRGADLQVELMPSYRKEKRS